MPTFVSDLFTATFMPHGHCYFWNPVILWLNVGTDFLIALSYYSIPLAIIYFIRRREDLIFDRIFLLFAIFILACGTTHLVEIWNVWNGHYALAGVVKAVTATASVITAISLWKLIPVALKIPSISQLETANKQLGEEIVERKKAEAEVKDLNTSLEEKVKEATRNERAARDRAEKESLLKDEFLATLSHELRTPLNAILGWTQILKANRSQDEFEKGLSIIERNSRIQTKLIEDLLDMSRIVSGKLHLDTREVNIVMSLEIAVSSVRPSAEAKGISIHREIDAQSVMIKGDPARLQQIFWNLLSNSIKFTPQGGNIRIRLRSDSSHVEIEVEDSGIGISSEFLPFVFERFRQEDSSITRSALGLGLGLSIVKQLVELHGGTITASSKGAGQGASFKASFPILDSTHTKNSSPASISNTLSRNTDFEIGRDYLKNIKVIVVDDHLESREIVKIILSAHGAEVALAENTTEALQLLESEEFDLLISDIGMPERDGYELLKELRKSSTSKNRHTPAIALTAFAQAEDRARAAMAGFHTHIAKPIEPSELLVLARAMAVSPRGEQ